MAKKWLSMSAKTQTDYWKQKVFQLKYKKANGEDGEVETYSVRIQHKGRREVFSTGEPNKQHAAKKAREIYEYLRSNGWENAISKYKEPTTAKPEKVATVGDVLRIAEEVSSVSERTLSQYKSALRKLAQDIANIKDTPKKYSYRVSGAEKEAGETISGHQKWVDEVDAVSLEKLTPTAILAWKNKANKRNASNPGQQRKDKEAAESTIRRARSLFGRKILKDLKANLMLPDTLPFDDERFRWKASTKRYVQSVEPKKLIALADDELPEDKPEVYTALLLCLLCGLRRAEADCLTWKQVDLSVGTIHIKETSYFKPKAEEHTRVIQMPKRLIELLAKVKKATDNPQQSKIYVLNGGSARPSSRHAYYRADIRPWKTWKQLIVWLRANGVNSEKPNHELRKMSGSLINESFGIEAARQHLGHQDVSTTSKSYLGASKRACVDL